MMLNTKRNKRSQGTLAGMVRIRAVAANFSHTALLQVPDTNKSLIIIDLVASSAFRRSLSFPVFFASSAAMWKSAGFLENFDPV